MVRWWTVSLVLAALGTVVEAATPDPETLAAWDRYVLWTEHRMRSERAAGASFLLLDGLPEKEADNAREAIRAGDVFTKKLETHSGDGRPIPMPDGLVHHWLGIVFIPGTSVDALLPWLQDYDAHHRYFDEVEASRLLSRDGDDFRMFLRLRRKKVVTVHHNTEHLVRYSDHGPGRASSISYATRIAEIDDAGTPHEREKPVGDDRGFLWRLNSYWRFQEASGGVVVEIESVSLSRGVPRALRWLVGRYLDSVPKESLEATLMPIRRRAPKARTTSR